MTDIIDLPHSLIHIGLVCRDMDLAQQHLSSTLGMHFQGGSPERWGLVVHGQPRSLELRIAHGQFESATDNSGPWYELIESVADTPWQTDAVVSLHHLCIHSHDSSSLCTHLETRGWQRVLGKAGDASGYFQQTDGLLVEVVDDNLLAYLKGFYSAFGTRFSTKNIHS